jgi:hypothetical protein
VEAVNSLVSFWRELSLDGTSFVHPRDWETLVTDNLKSRFDSTPLNFKSFVESPRFGNFADNRFYEALLPQPYFGCLDAADIVILMLNPGFQIVDYYAQERNVEFRKILERSLRQELADDEYPFPWLNPDLCWHSGFIYWERKLRDVLKAIAKRYAAQGYLKALRALSKRVAVLQLVPYNSAQFDAGDLIGELKSTSEVKEYVKKELESAAIDGKKTLIVTRQSRSWSLAPREPSIIVYEGAERRGASLGLTSRGGRAILRQFDLGSAERTPE